MAKRRPTPASLLDTTVTANVLARLANLEATYEVLIDSLDERLHDMTEAHNALDAKFEGLFYRVLYVMETLTIRRRRAGLITSGMSDTEEGTILEFFLKEGDAYITKLKREEAAVAESLAQTDRARAAHDVPETNGGSPEPDADATDTPLAPEKVTSINLAAARTRGSH